MAKATCPCPLYCRYCGSKRRRDSVGHYCPTRNCQWQHGYAGCTVHEKKPLRPIFGYSERPGE